MKAVNVLETNVLHASDVVFWLDGTSAENPSDMLRVPVPLALQLTARPRDLQVVHSAGKTAFLRRPGTELIAGVAGESDKQRPSTPTFTLAGTVGDSAGRYIPRRFTISAGNAAGHGLVVYPSPLGTRFGPSGGLLGTLRFVGAGDPVPWALLTLRVTTVLGTILTFRCQASASGDFMLPLNRLPPLPEGIDQYAGSLSIAALTDASADSPVDPADLVAMDLGELDSHTFSSPIGLNVAPGDIRLIRSSSQDHLFVQPS